ncbi:Crp/Fnr family transcriptional regulator [Flavobacterium wongokense]|uniref:Crp/Fnr family transcriptional regulator n=1 Tax=Flavobacterium wongokense TaxID=2910674 RepID=UPI001F486CCD|nr:Crp/Fnr family transcriptional regulator [Flavobacterium sp. WG47]MCF6132168.1 Crp/Fnr family transcriptional regulator [Flavobacterium sp. WG47]
MNQLIEHIKRFIEIDDAESAIILSYFEEKSYPKKTQLLEEGQICTTQYFILKGCLRLYIINDKGNEQTLQFGIENWWITDYMSLQTQHPTHFYIQTVENSQVMAIRKDALDDLLGKVPKMERYFRLILQKSYAASQMRIKFLYTQSAEERYHHFNSVQPEFVQRIPQYMLASYLDFSAEFMSKIRAGKV